MKKKTGAPKVIKTSVSLPKVLVDFAEKHCAEEGYNSLSAYIAELIRRDKQRWEGKDGKTVYPPHRDQITRIEDKP